MERRSEARTEFGPWLEHLAWNAAALAALAVMLLVLLASLEWLDHVTKAPATAPLAFARRALRGDGKRAPCPRWRWVARRAAKAAPRRHAGRAERRSAELRRATTVRRKPCAQKRRTDRRAVELLHRSVLWVARARRFERARGATNPARLLSGLLEGLLRRLGILRRGIEGLARAVQCTRRRARRRCSRIIRRRSGRVDRTVDGRRRRIGRRTQQPPPPRPQPHRPPQPRRRRLRRPPPPRPAPASPSSAAVSLTASAAPSTPAATLPVASSRASPAVWRTAVTLTTTHQGRQGQTQRDHPDRLPTDHSHLRFLRSPRWIDGDDRHPRNRRIHPWRARYATITPITPGSHEIVAIGSGTAANPAGVNVSRLRVSTLVPVTGSTTSKKVRSPA